MEELMGVVVTYYPNKNIKDHIGSWAGRVREVAVIDNTPGGSPVLKELFPSGYPSLTIVYNGVNKGIATALNQGAEIACKKGYHWILTMDQDSAFADGRFFDEFPHFRAENVAVIAPGNDAANHRPDPLTDPVTEPPVVMTSGSLINLHVWEAIGRFNDKLFIDEVDHDYCLRALIKNYRIIQLNSAILRHRLGDHQMIGFAGIKRCIHFHSPERTYYIFRNNCYMFKVYSSEFPGLMKKRKAILIRDLLVILLFAPCKLRHLRYAVKGIRDFRKNRYGQIPVRNNPYCQ